MPSLHACSGKRRSVPLPPRPRICVTRVQCVDALSAADRKSTSPWKTPEQRPIPMIDLYALTSPNVQKIYIMLEECGLPYKEHFVDVWKGEQYKPEFAKINPNNK